MHKICLRHFGGSCKGSGTNGEWGRPVETRVKGRPMLKNNTRIAGDAEIVDEAILSRRSVRAFLPDMVDDDTIRAILAVAARAPSGTNMQPWKVYVTKGETKQRITDAILNSGIRAEKADWDEYRYYPTQFFEPYQTRRRANGFGLYGALGIGRREVDTMRAQHDRNFVFFDAPVGMIFTIDRRLNQGSWIDYGMFLANIATAARGRGLDSCHMAVFAEFPRTVRRLLGLTEADTVVCGMALGHADPDAPANRLVTERVAAAEFGTFQGF